MSGPSYFQPFSRAIRRELLLAFRNLGQSVNPLIFYLIIVTLFPLGIGADRETLMQIAPAVVWVAALLATLLAADGIFRADYEDGSLEQLACSPSPFVGMVSVKIFTHWLMTGLPLVLLAPVLGILFSLSVQSTVILVYTLLLGTPVLSLVSAMGAALTLSVRNGGALLALIVLPMKIPVLLFATRCVGAVSMGLPVDAQLLFLTALLVLAISLLPVVIATALKLNLN